MMTTIAELQARMREKKAASASILEEAKPILNSRSEGEYPVPVPVDLSIEDTANYKPLPFNQMPVEYQEGWNSAQHGYRGTDNPYNHLDQSYSFQMWNDGYVQFHMKETEEEQLDSEVRKGILDTHSRHLEGDDPDIVNVEIIDESQLDQIKEIILNEKQSLVRTMALAGTSICCIGAAGTGKTTCMKKTTKDMIDAGHIPIITNGTKHLRVGHPGIAVISFTNKAVNNIRKNVDPRIKVHTITAHKLLEFRPVKYEIEDENTGKMKLTMKFEPSRTADNPLPPELRCLIWEESSMVGTPLYNLVKEAMPHNHQEIFLGDIQQLPPVFGSAVLGFKMNELPVVELTEVYRQALESPIIKLAWKILEGNPHDFSSRVEREMREIGGKKKVWFRYPGLEAWNYNDPVHGSLEFRVWQTTTTETQALMATQMMFKNWYNEGKYNPYKDIILCPFNMKYGTTEINKLLSQYFSIQRQEPVHEIVAGYEKVYYAVGDRVLVGKEDAFIESIELNPAYLGKTSYCMPSIYLDRWGVQQTPVSAEEALQHKIDSATKDEDQAEYFLDGEGGIDDIEGDSRVNAASHIVTCRLSYSDEVVILKNASELKPPAFLGGYCLTVHKFQGSEEEKVFIILHKMHEKMIRRELLYTAVTRARKHLVIICENTSFEKGVVKQAIKGNTIAEKAEVFKGKLEDINNDDDIPRRSENLQFEVTQSEVVVENNYLQELPAQPLQPKEQVMDTYNILKSEPERSLTMKEKLEIMKQKLRSKK